MESPWKPEQNYHYNQRIELYLTKIVGYYGRTGRYRCGRNKNNKVLPVHQENKNEKDRIEGKLPRLQKTAHSQRNSKVMPMWCAIGVRPKLSPNSTGAG
jgi:hypothetical protein